MICRYYLHIGSDSYDVSNQIDNLSDIKITYTRSGLNGVSRKCGSTINFISDARDILINLFDTDGIKSCAYFSVSQITNNWEFEESFRCQLDFSTFTYDEYTASISCLDNDIESVLKANKATTYEFFVSDLKESKKLNYDGVIIRNEKVLILSGDTVEGESYTRKEFDNRIADWWWIPYIGTADTGSEIHNKAFVFQDQTSAMPSVSGDNTGWGFPANPCNTSWFLECLKDNEITIDFSTIEYSSDTQFAFALFKIDTAGNVSPLTCGYSNMLSLDSNTRPGSVKWTGTLKKGEKLQYAIFNHNPLVQGHADLSSLRINTGECGSSWDERGDSYSIDVVRPVTLLNAILKKIFPETDVNGSIYESIGDTLNERLRNSYLVAAESIREMSTPRIYTSFSKFCEYMEAVYGYVYIIDENSIKFIHRSDLFSTENRIVIGNVSDFNYTVASDRIYSSVQIGYEKQDYDFGNNGSDEFNFNNTYTTGCTIKDSKLTIMSPYRADCYGFVELAEKRNQDSTTTDSDQQIFIVVAVEGNSGYDLDRSVDVQGTYTYSVFNALLSPRYMIEANIGYLSSFASELTFASSEANSDIVIDGKKMNENIALGTPTFGLGDISFEMSNVLIEADWNSSCIELEFEGKEIVGAVNSMEYTLSNIESIKYELIELK